MVLIKRKYLLMVESGYNESEIVKKFDKQEDLFKHLETLVASKDLMGPAPEYWIKELLIPEKV